MENPNQNQVANNTHLPPHTQPGESLGSSSEEEKKLRQQIAAEDELSRALAEEKTAVQIDSNTPHVTKKDEIFQIRPASTAQAKEAAPLPSDVIPSNGVTNSPFKKTSASEPRTPASEKKTVTEEVPQTKPETVETNAPVKTAPHGFVPNPKLKTLRTFHGDMAEIVRDKGESVTSIAVAARKKKDEEIKPRPVAIESKAPEKKSSLANLSAEKYPQRTPLPHTAPQSTWHDQSSVPSSFEKPTPVPSKALPPSPSHHATMPSITTTNPRKNEAIPVKAAASIPFFKNMFLLIVSLALFGFAGFTIYTVFFAKSLSEQEITPYEPQTLVAYDTYVPVTPASQAEFISHIQALKDSLPGEAGSVVYAHIESSPEAALTTLATDMPEVLSRILEHPYAIGYYRDGQKPVFFTALTVESFGQAFSGMLSWEPRLYAAMLPLYGTSRTAGVSGGFSDVIIENKDVRKLTGADQETALVYGFIDDKTLIITENEASFRGVANNILIKRSTR